MLKKLIKFVNEKTFQSATALGICSIISLALFSIAHQSVFIYEPGQIDN